MSSAGRIPVLTFASASRAGEEFPLEQGRSYIAGRSAEADLTLADDSVSRKHARFYFSRGAAWLADLGSRNGTQVNGRAVRRHRLREGDRIAIGASLLRVAFADATTKTRRRGEDSAGRSMSGSIQDIPLADVLQWLAGSRKTGALKVKGRDQLGALYLREGDVYYAKIGGRDQLHPEKALLRMLRWTEGMFELDNNAPSDLPQAEIAPSLGSVLMEAARQQDEMAHLADRSAVPEETVKPASPSKVPWKELEPEELDFLQAIVEARFDWQEVLDGSELDDLSLTRKAVKLHKKGVLVFDE